MKKLIIRLLVAGLLLTVVALGAAVLYVDQIAAAAIAEGGKRGLGVETKVQAVSVGWLGGNTNVDGAFFGSPAGFSAPHTLRIGRGDTDIQIGKLMGDVIEVDSLVLRDLDYVLERKDGKTNVETMIAHAYEVMGWNKPPDPSKPAPKATVVVIKELRMLNVRVTSDTIPLPAGLGKLEVVIPEIKLTNVGKETNGVELAELSVIILQALTQALLEKAAVQLPAALLNELKGVTGNLADAGLQVVGDVTGKLTSAAGELVSSIGEQPAKLLGKAGDTVSEGVKQAESAVSKAASSAQSAASKGVKQAEGAVSKAASQAESAASKAASEASKGVKKAEDAVKKGTKKVLDLFK